MGRLQSALTALASQGLFATNSTPAVPSEFPVPDETVLASGSTEVESAETKLDAADPYVEETTQAETPGNPITQHRASQSNEVELPTETEHDVQLVDQANDASSAEPPPILPEVMELKGVTEVGEPEELRDDTCTAEAISSDANGSDTNIDIADERSPETLTQQKLFAADFAPAPSQDTANVPHQPSDEAILESDEEAGFMQSSSSEMQDLLGLLGITATRDEIERADEQPACYVDGEPEPTMDKLESSRDAEPGTQRPDEAPEVSSIDNAPLPANVGEAEHAEQSACGDEAQLLSDTSTTEEIEIDLSEPDDFILSNIEESVPAIRLSAAEPDVDLVGECPNDEDLLDEHSVDEDFADKTGVDPIAADEVKIDLEAISFAISETTSNAAAAPLDSNHLATNPTDGAVSNDEYAPAETLETVHGEDDDVMLLVEQVLGITPEIRIDDETSFTVLDIDEDSATSNSQPQWEATEADEPEAVAVEESSTIAEASQKNPAGPTKGAYNPVLETWLTVDRNPHLNDDASRDISAEASPPFRTGSSEALRGTNAFPQTSPKLTHWPESTVKSSLAAQPKTTAPSKADPPTTEPYVPSPSPGPTDDNLETRSNADTGDDSSNNTSEVATHDVASDDVCESAPVESMSEDLLEATQHTPSPVPAGIADADESQGIATVSADDDNELANTAKESASMSNHGSQNLYDNKDSHDAELEPDAAIEQPVTPSQLSAVKAKPTNYEVTLAQRLLHSDFGVQIQELDAELTKQLEGPGPHVVLLVSLESNTQQAEVATALSMTVCVQRSGPTLLVDADLEVRSITQGFEATGGGLLDEIMGTADYLDCVKPTSCEQLKLLSTGTDFASVNSTDPTEIVQRIANVVVDWKRHFDLVLIDAGRATSWMAKQLSPHADATFVCVKLGHSQRERLLAVTQQLTSEGARVKGCITTSDAS